MHLWHKCIEIAEISYTMTVEIVLNLEKSSSWTESQSSLVTVPKHYVSWTSWEENLLQIWKGLSWFTVGFTNWHEGAVENKCKFRRLLGKKWFPLWEKKSFQQKGDGDSILGTQFRRKVVAGLYLLLAKRSLILKVYEILMDHVKCKYYILLVIFAVGHFNKMSETIKTMGRTLASGIKRWDAVCCF